MNLKYSFLLILLILPYFIASDDVNYPQEFEEKADSLIDLTETNFDQNVFSGDNDPWFVMFYTRWCPHCQDATSVFNELAKALDGKVKVGRVDCDANPGLRDRYSIQGIPTFLYFYKDEIHQYEGDRTVEAWTQFTNEGFKKTKNKKPEDIKTVEDEAHYLVDHNQENSEDIIRNPGLLMELTDKNFDSQVKNGDRRFERWFVMFYVPWCPHSQNATPAFEELANSLQNQLNFGKVDCDTEDALREKYSIQAYPTFLYFYKGEIRQYEGDRTVEAWTDFVNSGYKQVGTTEPQEAKAVEENSTPVNSEEILSQETYLSENQPLENPENITQQPPVQESSLPVNVQWKDDSLIELSDVNFNYKVLTGTGKWFIMLYNPWCPVCRETMPTFIQLAKSLQGEVSVGRVDVDANPYIRSRYAIQGHPTFLYFEKKEPSKYEGENTVEAWTEFVKNGGPKNIVEENKTSLAPGISQPESIDYLVQQPLAEAVPERPENVTQQLPVEKRPQFERAENISQLPENAENITQQFPDQGRPQPETPVNIPQLPENVENITQQLPNEGVPQPENITQQLPDQVRPQPESPENITQQVPVQERPHPETAENITQQFPDQVRPLPETPVNITQQIQERPHPETAENITQQFLNQGIPRPESPENITQQLPNEGVPQPESPANITQQIPVQERPHPETAENITQQFPDQGIPQPESPENVTQQLPVQERPQVGRTENISELPESPENITQQVPVQERPQPETAKNITQQFPVQGIPQPESSENVTQQLPVQERPQVESPENITQQVPVQERPQPETPVNIPQLPENTENITQQVPVQERPYPETAENITQQFPDQVRPQPETPVNIPQFPENTQNITQQIPVQGRPQPESPENVTQQLPIQERPQVERAENISMLPENAENITQQLPNQGILQPESPENVTQPVPVQENRQPETLEGALIDLTEANFDNNVHSDENRKWFVMFYTPWCPHCNEAMPAFGELANSLRDQVSIGKVDCDANPGLRDRFSIQAFPIFLYFYKGEIHQYKGPREIEAWTEFATTHYRYTDIQAPDEDKIIERDTTPLNRNESIAAPPQIPETTEEKTDSLIELCDDDFDSRVFSNVEEKWFVMFYDPSCPRCQEVMPIFGELANSLNGRVRVALVDCDANPGLAARYNIQDHPTFLLFYQGESHQYDGLRTIEAWTDFATTDYKSTEVPETETETVIERDSAPFYFNESVVPPQTPEITEEKTDSLIDLCDDDFESNVFSQDKEKWFVMFYAPWCPHCHAAMPAFGDFANSLKDRVSVARVDCEANPGLRDKYSIQGYPTFLFFYKGEIHQYEGPRTVEAWTEFVTRDYKGTETQTPEEAKEIDKDSSPIPSEPEHVPQERNPIIPAEETGSLIDLNKDNFNTQVFANEDDKWMIMFYAPWCPHCKHAMPAFKELAKVVKGHAKVGRVDCDANPELRTRFAIEGYPTFLFFSDGDVRRFEGARTIEAWSNFVDEGYKKVKAIEENVHEIREVVHHAKKFFELTPVVMIIGGALIGAVLLFCFLAITRRKDDTTIRHAQLEGTDISDDSRIYMD